MDVISIDNRGLEPPEPMVRILTALGTITAEQRLVALMDREPFLLYPELERRGFCWEFQEGAEHHTITIRRATEG